ncbi:MAG: pyrroline-5-carboxylate reductase [Sedimentisphaerales bacterium]|nr:pyrroline-5-carboxylate reductase [Sedimentisphaerales bacterium]
MSTIGFIGSGNMAEALIKGIISAKVYEPSNIMVSDIKEERLGFLAGKYEVKVCRDSKKLASCVDTVVLSVKPQNMNDVLENIKNSIGSVKLVISIAAGIKVEKIASVLGDIAIIRVMPNTPALIGEGAAALYANDKAKGMINKTLAIFSAVGKAVVVEEEGLIDAVTAVSGSGPAYFFLLMEEMIKAGVELGLPEDTAKELVLQTAKGAGMLASNSNKNAETPAMLRKKVTSPGGTTEAALNKFAEGNFGSLVSAALKRASERSKELSGS